NGDGRVDWVVSNFDDLLFNCTETACNCSRSPDVPDHWLVYLNTGAGFSRTSIAWHAAAGGLEFGFLQSTGATRCFQKDASPASRSPRASLSRPSGNPKAGVGGGGNSNLSYGWTRVMDFGARGTPQFVRSGGGDWAVFHNGPKPDL